MNSKAYHSLETVGGAVVFLIATFLHFFYRISDEGVIGALFGSVNESVWEHLKIYGIAFIAYAAVIFLWSKPELRIFVPAKAVGLIILWAGITLVFYTYSAFLRKPAFWVDIIFSLFFLFIAHFVSYRITTRSKKACNYFYTGLFFILLALGMILCFSYFPPHNPLFKDPVTGLYGIPNKTPDPGAAVLDTIYYKSL